MRQERLTKEKAQVIWSAVTDAVQRTPRLQVKLPALDMGAIFGDRKTMTCAAIVGEISRAIDIVNTPEQ